MLYIIICTFLVLTTVVIANFEDPVRTPKEIMALLGLVCIIWSGLRYIKPKSSLSLKWMWIFFLWCILDSFWIVNKHLFQFDFITQSFAYFLMCRYMLYILLGVVSIHILANVSTLCRDYKFRLASVKSESDLETQTGSLLRFIAGMSMIMAGYVLLVQVPGLDQYIRVIGSTELGTGSFAHRLVGTLGNPSVLSMWFAMTIPCILYSRKYITLGMVLTCLWIQQGATGIIAGTIALFFYLFFAQRKVFFISIFSILLLTGAIHYTGLVNVRDRAISYSTRIAHDEGRFLVWKQTFKDAKEFSLTGQGLGSFEWKESIKIRPLFPHFPRVIWRHSHNEYVNIYFETGMIGFGLFLMFVLSVFWKFLKTKKTPVIVALMSIMVAFLIDAIGLFAFSIGTSIFLGIISLGLLLNLLEKNG